MKKIGIWLQTEYKRAAAVLPLILKRAVILTVVCLGAVGIIALCTKVFWNEDKEMPKLRVGYVAEENMSRRDICRFRTRTKTALCLKSENHRAKERDIFHY